jgi:hypothetical protein
LDEKSQEKMEISGTRKIATKVGTRIMRKKKSIFY